MTQISYHALPGKADWFADVRALLERTGAKRVADLGAGASPVLTPEEVEQYDLDYTIFDISATEMEKAGSSYRGVVADVTAPGFAGNRTFDLVLSRWLLEHISDPAAFHDNVFSMLTPGGRAMHFFPTLYSVPFMINRILPESISQRLLGSSLTDLASGRGKFPARYRWCRGPTRGQLRRMGQTGFVIENYIGFFGHPYFRRVPAVDALERRFASTLARHPFPALTSFSSMTLLKPG